MGNFFGAKDQTAPIDAAVDFLEKGFLLQPLCAIVREYAKDFEGAHRTSLVSKSDTVVVAALPQEKLASSHHNGTILIWDVAAAKIVRKLKGHTKPVTKLCAFEHTLASLAACDHVVRVWNAETGECKSCVHMAYADNIALFPDGRLAIDVNGVVSVWDGQEVRVVVDGSWITAFTTWGTAIVTGMHHGILTIHGADSARVFKMAGWITSFAVLSADLIAVGCEDRCVRVLSLASGELVRVFNQHTHKVDSVVAFQDKVASCSKYEICIWSLHDDAVTTMKQGSSCLAVVGQWLVAGGTNPIRVYE